MLIARIYEVFPLVCPKCGGELKIVAFLNEADPIQRLLIHIGEPATPTRTRADRAPPDWLEVDFDQTTANDSEIAEPMPEFDKSSEQMISRQCDRYTDIGSCDIDKVMALAEKHNLNIVENVA